MTASDRPTSGAPEGLDDMCPNCVTPWKCNGPHDPAPAAPVVSSEGEAALRGQVSAALYKHNSPVIELPDDEYDCCADVAIAAVLDSDWLAAALATARAEGKRTLGSLTADDIGSYVEFWDTHEGEPRFGVLKSAYHHTAAGFPSTWVRLDPFDGPFMCRSDSPVQVRRAALSEEQAT